jgi:hypothetical protein
MLLIMSGIVASAASETLWQRREALQREDLRSVTAWFKKKNPALSRFSVGDKRSIDGTYAAIVVTAFDEKQRPPLGPWLGVFVVYGKTNQVYMVLDIRPAPRCCSPQLQKPTSQVVYVDWLGDYGFYGGTQKYVYDLAPRGAPKGYAYHRFSVQTAQAKPGAITFFGHYSATGELGTHPSLENIALLYGDEGRWYVRKVSAVVSQKREPEDDSRIPTSVINAIPPLPGGSRPGVDRFVKARQGLWLYIPAAEVPGYGRQSSGVYVVNTRGAKQFYPVPVPTTAQYDELRRRTGQVAFTPGPAPGGLENSIGPYAFDGSKLWFGNRFYDGEGTSGVGAIGSFDLASRSYEMRYLPEIAPWSASVLAGDSGSIWVGLMRQPEGAAYGGGVLRFDPHSGSARKYPISDYVTTIMRVGSALFFGTAHGVYVYQTETNSLTHVRVEPGSSSPLQVVTLKIEPLR